MALFCLTYPHFGTSTGRDIIGSLSRILHRLFLGAYAFPLSTAQLQGRPLTICANVWAKGACTYTRANQISEDAKWQANMNKHGVHWDPTWWENVDDLPAATLHTLPPKTKLKGTNDGHHFPLPKEAEEWEAADTQCSAS